MKTILYIGNKLAKHGITPTTIDTLGPRLEEYYQLYYASDKKGKIQRMADMVMRVFGKSRNLDFILIDTYATLNFWYAFAVAQVARLLNLKYIPILHGGNLPDRLSRNPRLCRMIFGHSFVNVAPSDYLGSAFRKAGFQIVRIPNFIQLDQYSFEPRTTIIPRLLWVRSLEQNYHPEMAIRVTKQLAETYPDCALCMVGPDKDGSLSVCTRLAAELGISDRVRFTGKLSKADWIALSTEYSVFINTTNYDNTPVSVIEAMALGLPVVSTNVGGIPYLVEDGKDGLLVNKGDVDGMANAIIHLVENKELAAEMVRNARKKVEQFDVEQVMRQWVELLGN